MSDYSKRLNSRSRVAALTAVIGLVAMSLLLASPVVAQNDTGANVAATADTEQNISKPIPEFPTKSESGVSAQDRNEPDGSFAESTPITDGTYTGYEIAGGEDYFAITLVEGEELTASIDFDHSVADVDMALYDPEQNIIESSTSVTDDESISTTVDQAGTYYVRVYRYSGDQAEYSITVETSGNSGTTFETAIPVESGITNTYQVDGEDDYYSVTLNEGEELDASIEFDDSDADIDMELYNPSQTEIDGSYSTSDGESVSTTAEQAGTYYIRVYRFSGGDETYQLTVSITGDETPAIDGSLLTAQNGLAVNDGLAYTIADGQINTIDIETREVINSFQAPDGTNQGLAYGAGSLWYADAATDSYDGRIVEIDPETGEQLSTIDTGYDPYGVAFGGGSLYVTEVTSIPDAIHEFSPDGTQIDEFGIGGPLGPVGAAPHGFAYYDGSLWVGGGPGLYQLGSNGDVEQRFEDRDTAYNGLAGSETTLYGPDEDGLLTVLRGSASDPVPNPSDAVGEVGTVTVDQPDRDTFFQQELENEYEDPVVIMKPVGETGNHPAHIRVRNVQPGSFEYQIEEWTSTDGPHRPVRVSYLVLESGLHSIDDNTVEAGTVQSNHEGATVPLSSEFDSDPVAFTQSQTENEQDPIITRTSFAVYRPSSNTYELATQLQEEESADQTHATERVGYVVFESGTGTIEGTPFEVGTTRVGTVTDDPYQIDFSSSFSTTPQFVADSQTVNGDDTAQVRLSDISTDSASVFMEEETTADDETSHSGESIGYFAVGDIEEIPDTGNVDPEPENNDPSGAVTVDDGTYDGELGPINDYYAIDVESGERIDIEVRFDHDNGDLDAELINPSGDVVDQSTSTTDDERVSTTASESGTYLVNFYRVGSGDGNNYTFTVDTPITTENIDPDENDDPSGAVTIGDGVYEPQFSGLEDYFAVELSEGERIVSTIRFDNAVADMDAEIVGPNGNVLDASTSTTDDETVSIVANQDATYYVRAFGSTSTNGYTYELDVQTGEMDQDVMDELNNDPSGAAVVPDGTYEGLIGGVDDYYAIDVDDDERISVDVDFDHGVGDVEAELIAPDGRTVDASTSTTDGESVSVDQPTSGKYLLHIYRSGGDLVDYTFTVETPASPANDDFEPNNERETAAPLNPGTYTDLQMVGSEDDWYAVELESGESIEASIEFADDINDMDLELVDSVGTTIDRSTSVSNSEFVSATVEEPGEYYLRVYGLDQATAAYDLTVGTTVSNENDRYEPNDRFESATQVSPGTFDNLQIVSGESDYFTVEVAPDETLRAAIDFQDDIGDLDLAVYDSELDQVDLSASTSDDEEVFATADTGDGGMYYVEVYGYAGASAPYSLTIDRGAETPGEPELPERPQFDNDRFEPNNQPDTSAAIEPGTYDDLATAPGDIDAFNLELDQGDELAAAVDTATQEIGASVEIFYESDDGSGLVEVTESNADPEQATVSSAEQAGTYHVVVYPEISAVSESVSYTLSVERTASTPGEQPPEDPQPPEQPPTEDQFEPNDIPPEAATIAPGTYEDMTAAREDADWYELDAAITEDQRVDASIEFSQTDGNLDLILVHESQSGDFDTTVRSTSTTSNERLILSTPEPTGQYYLLVYGSSGTPVPYTLSYNLGETGSTQNSQPTATFEYSPESPAVGSQVTFDAADATDSDGTISAYEWDLDGDGATDTVGEQVTRAFFESGTYTVSLTVTDDEGATNTTIQNVEVGEESASGDKDGLYVRFDPQNTTVGAGGTTTYNIVTENVSGEIAAVDLRVTTSEPATAKITDVTQEINAGLGITESVASDGSSADISGSLGTTDASGSVTLGTVTVEGVTTGNSTLSVEVSELADTQGEVYTVGVVEDGEVVVTDESVGPGDITGNGAVPTDPDNDGVYEDVNGDGDVTFGDLQGLYSANQNGRINSENSDFFDFNEDGSISISDVQALFAQELRRDTQS